MHELRFLRSENIRDIIQNTRKLNKQGMKILNNRQIIKCEIFHQRLHKKVTSGLEFHFHFHFQLNKIHKFLLWNFVTSSSDDAYSLSDSSYGVELMLKTNI
jgi:hypothetical protein